MPVAREDSYLGDCHMSEKIAAALGFAVPATVLTTSDAEAQTAGMERREGRRTGREERRQGRRNARQTRREAR
jgi:hypothetical protein